MSCKQCSCFESQIIIEFSNDGWRREHSEHGFNAFVSLKPSVGKRINIVQIDRRNEWRNRLNMVS